MALSRWTRPNGIFPVDVVRCRNISGENANWITIGTTIRFRVPEGKPARERTGHLCVIIPGQIAGREVLTWRIL
jgi:hypothetical protein